MNFETSLSPSLGTNCANSKTLHGSFTLGSSGAVASSDIPGGFCTITKTNAKTARYSMKLHRGYGRLQNLVPTLEGPADAAFGNTVGNAVGLRNMNASAGTADIQIFLASSGADTDGASGYVVRFSVDVTDYKGP